MEVKLKKIIDFWLPPALWAGLIFFFSSLQTIKTSEVYWQDFLLKKMAHMIEYGIFAVLLYRGFRNSGFERKNAALYSILIVLIYGATDEFHQNFTPGREPKVRDVVFDTLGGILAIWSLWNLLPKAPKKFRDLTEKFQLT